MCWCTQRVMSGGGVGVRAAELPGSDALGHQRGDAAPPLLVHPPHRGPPAGLAQAHAPGVDPQPPARRPPGRPVDPQHRPEPVRQRRPAGAGRVQRVDIRPRGVLERRLQQLLLVGEVVEDQAAADSQGPGDVRHPGRRDAPPLNLRHGRVEDLLAPQFHTLARHPASLPGGIQQPVDPPGRHRGQQREPAGNQERPVQAQGLHQQTGHHAAESACGIARAGEPGE
jgi:hypothetical protein